MILYEIGFHLGMPLYKLKAEMPYDELIGWQLYLERRPVGWREDDRTVKLMQIQGYKGSGREIFPSLAALYEHQQSRKAKDNFPMASFKKSAFFSKIAAAKGGEKLDFD